jgi:hypothetical protein
MSGMSNERIEPTPRVVEPPGPEYQGQPDSGSRRRRPAVPDEAEVEGSADTPAHRVDRLA